MNQNFQIIDEKDYGEINILNQKIKSIEQQNAELYKIIELMKNKIEFLQNELEINKNIIDSFNKNKFNDIESNMDVSSTPCIDTIDNEVITNTNYITDCINVNFEIIIKSESVMEYKPIPSRFAAGIKYALSGLMIFNFFFLTLFYLGPQFVPQSILLRFMVYRLIE